MAKQIGTIKLVGTIDDITYYEMEGEHWARKKSSLTGERVRKDPAFEGSRRAAGRFGAGSALASAVYWQLPKKARKHGLQGKLTAMASRALQAGSTESEVTALLMETLGIEGCSLMVDRCSESLDDCSVAADSGQVVADAPGGGDSRSDAEGVATKTPRHEGAQSREGRCLVESAEDVVAVETCAGARDIPRRGAEGSSVGVLPLVPEIPMPAEVIQERLPGLADWVVSGEGLLCETSVSVLTVDRRKKMFKGQS